MKPYLFTRRAEGLPGLKGPGGDAARAAFFALAELLSERDPQDRDKFSKFRRQHSGPVVDGEGSRGYYRRWACTTLFAAPHAKALGKLYAAMQSGMDQAYREGHNDGSNLLQRLARGEITVDSYEEQRRDATNF